MRCLSRLMIFSLLSVGLLAPAFAQEAAPATGSAAVPTSTTASDAQARLNSWLEGPIPPEVGKVIAPEAVPVLRGLVQPGGELRYLGDEYGLKAYFMTNNGFGQVIYTTPDNKAVVVGTMFTNDGSAVSFLQLLRLRRTGFDPTPYFKTDGDTSTAATSPAVNTPPPAVVTAPPTNETPGERLLREANAASWIAYGDPNGAAIAVFMDPACGHCHDLFKLLLPYTEQGKVYLRLIPISLIDASKSRPYALSILSAPNPADAWKATVNGQAPAPVAKPDNKVELALAANNKLFLDWQLKVTPYAIYRSPVTKDVKVLSAVPSDMSVLLKDMGVTP